MADASENQKSSEFYDILHHYAEWHSQVLRAVFYPEKIVRQDIAPPQGLEEQLRGLIQGDDEGGNAVIAETLSRQAELHAAAHALLTASDKPDLATFESFLNLYESFTQRVARFDIDSVLSGHGIDNATGLRTANVIIADLERELERRARRGHPFSIVLAQIDKPDMALVPDQMKLAADVIKFCMRSFDDAYVSGKSEILVSLKQTENAGALRFVERLKYILTERGATFTMSFCAAEPMPGDDVQTLIKNVRSDLRDMAQAGGGEAGEYEEISPLQRFLKGMKKEL